jgi:LysR family glycine cleavage system transcriptional activator
LLNLPLLHLDDRSAWQAWFAAAGVTGIEVIHGPILNRASMLIDAAIDGQGVALARTALAAWDLIHKRLVRPFPVALPLSKSYWIVCPQATADLPKLIVFRDWLLRQASDDTRSLEGQLPPNGRSRGPTGQPARAFRKQRKRIEESDRLRG